MHASAWLPAVLGAAMVRLGAPGVAAADDLPPCDPATTPLAHLTGLTDQLVAGRDFEFSIAADNVPDRQMGSDIAVTMSEDGVVFWSGTVNSVDAKNEKPGMLSIRSD